MQDFLKTMDKKTSYLLILIMLLGTFLRFYDLSGESFWLDEGTTSITVVKYDAWEIFQNVKEHGQTLSEYYPQYDEDLPLYYMVLRGWVNLFGTSEFAFRSFSALFGVLSLLAVFYLAKYLFNNKIALLATFLTAISLQLIWYSREARQYSGLLFLSILSIIFLIRSLKEGKTRHVVGFVITNAFIIYSHFPWLLFFAFEGLYALIVMYKGHAQKKALNKKVIIAFLIMGLLYAPIIDRALFSKSQFVQLFGRPDAVEVGKFIIALSTWVYPSMEMREKLYSFSLGFTFSEWLFIFSLIAIVILYNLLFLRGCLKLNYKKEPELFAALFFFVPFLSALIASLVHPTITVFMIRQLIYLIPAYLIIVAVGCFRTKFSSILIAIIILINILPLYSYYAHVDKQDFRSAAAYIPKGETVFTNIRSAAVVFQYYYGISDKVVQVKDLEDLKEDLKVHAKDTDSFWMLLTFTKYSDPEGKIKKYLNENYNLVEKKDFFEIEVLHYKKKD